MKKRNYSIDLFKFIFSIIIMLHHSYLLFGESTTYKHLFLGGGGNRAVEFFFLVSGYLTASTCLARKDQNVEEYMWHRIKPLVLPLWVSWLLSFTGTHLIMKNISFLDVARDALGSVFELLFLQNAGFKGKYYVGVSWYISALLISTLIICVPLKKYKEKYIFWMAPIFSIVILGFLSHEYGSIVNVHKWVGIAYKCQLRAFAEVNLGIFLFGIEQYVKKIDYTWFGKSVLSITEIFGYCAAITYMMRRDIFNFDYAVIIILAVSVLLSFSEKTYLFIVCDKVHNILGFLGKYSLYIYLNQKVCFQVIPYFWGNKSYCEQIVFYVAAVLICALFVMIIVDLLKKYVLPPAKRLVIKM